MHRGGGGGYEGRAPGVRQTNRLGTGQVAGGAEHIQQTSGLYSSTVILNNSLPRQRQSSSSAWMFAGAKEGTIEGLMKIRDL